MMMKTIYKAVIGFLAIAGMIFPVSGQHVDKKTWDKVESLISKGLPQSALTVVDSIYATAKTGNMGADLLKAALFRVRISSDYQEEFLESSIQRLEEESLLARTPVKQVIHSILAELYWRYFQANRYEILDRTALGMDPSADIRTWDQVKLTGMVTRHYLLSLSEALMLQAVPLKEFDAILIAGEGSKQYRPTLYDFLAHRAIDHFMLSEPELYLPAGGFGTRDERGFTPAQEFVAHGMTPGDTVSSMTRAIQVFCELLAFHLNDQDPRALIDADLKRLKFAWQESASEKKDSLYLNALEQIITSHPGHPSSADAMYESAMVHYQLGQQYDPYGAAEWRWEITKAREICGQAAGKFPDSDGARNCQVLLAEINRINISLAVRDAGLPGKSSLGFLTSRNVDTAYFRVILIDPARDLELRNKNQQEALVGIYRSMAPAESWKLGLKNENDHQNHSAQIAIPRLSLGYYVVLVSDNADFAPDRHAVAYTSFWVSRISYISKRMEDGSYHFYTLDRESGHSMKYVKAERYTREYDYKSRTYTNRKLDEFLTDENGAFHIPAGQAGAKSFYILFSKADDHYSTENYFFPYTPPKEQKPLVKTYFFTDRSIYRPGQTIYFKGIILEETGTEKKILPGYSTTVGLYDVNGQKVSEQKLVSSDYGSIQGTFSAPSGTLTGRMTIRSESGNIAVSIEEYKRPRFEVSIEPLQGSYRLNEQVKVTGAAMAYSGAALDNATVTYRVVRRARFPFWRDWWGIFPESPETEITNGMTKTDHGGKFFINFPAVPDARMGKKFMPVFQYTIYADVTDISGESHAAQGTVSVGYQAMIVDLGMQKELDLNGEHAFPIRATNLNGQPLPARGEVHITPLRPPDQFLRGRPWKRPDVFLIDSNDFVSAFPHEIYDDENNPVNWGAAAPATVFAFDTDKDSLLSIPGLPAWNPGVYKVEIKSTDTFGQSISSTEFITAFSRSSKKTPVPIADWFKPIQTKGEPGEKITILAGTAEKNVKVLYELIHHDKVKDQLWLELSQEQVLLDIPVLEEYRGNFSVSFSFVKGNRSYQYSQVISVPHSDRELDIAFETFRDKLDPGAEEEWRLRIRGHKGMQVAAEMLAAMYDASLDAFLPHSWNFNIFKYYGTGRLWSVHEAFGTAYSNYFTKPQEGYPTPVSKSYDQLNWFGFNYYGSPFMMRNMRDKGDMMAIPLMEGQTEGTMIVGGANLIQEEKAPEAVVTSQPIGQVPVRRNFEETAFFFPSLQTDDNGDVLIKFRVPESLTSWKFMGLAITKDLKTGQLTEELVTRKELMVVPNPPRFFREGDRFAFSAKVVSLADENLKGTIGVNFFDAFSMKPLDTLMGLTGPRKEFTVEKGKSSVYYWEVNIPEGIGAIVYRATVNSGTFSDGEEMAIPVLPNRMLVTESLPLPVNGQGSFGYQFEKLTDSGKSASIRNYRLTLEMTSNPAWYAVQALPYLSEYPHESADALFNRYYANSLAGHIAQSSPKIRQVFDSWRGLSPDALRSNLEKNPQLKAVLLEETPWVMEASSETERRQRIALLFDLNRIASEQETALHKLEQLQTANGGWKWFEGMPESRYITQLIVTGLGRLNHLGVINFRDDGALLSMAKRALYFLDDAIREDYDQLRKNTDKGTKLEDNHLSPLQVDYLYARSFYDGIVEVLPSAREAYAYYQSQAEKFWLEQSKYLQGFIALALQRKGNTAAAMSIVRSLKEHALQSSEMGMYWRDPAGYFWYQDPIDRQALMIEVFSEVSGDSLAVEKMKIWLLKHKQTHDWKTGRSTANAIYALLLKGTDLLESDRLVKVTLGNEQVDPVASDGVTPEAGTGYFQVSWAGSDIKPEMGMISITKEDRGVAWGAVYWQYYEDLDRISPAQSPLSIEKEIYREMNSPDGPVLEKIGQEKPLLVGDKIKVRIIVRTDRDMEYIHMKDMRSASFEPVNVLSGYRYQGGLGYYEATRDAAVNFYFDHLRKGTYVFEYPLMVTQAGEFSNGITSIQCLYAPEFGAHSEGARVRVERD